MVVGVVNSLFRFPIALARFYGEKAVFAMPCVAYAREEWQEKVRSGEGLLFTDVSHEFRHERCLGPIKVSYIRGELLQVSRGPAN